MAKIKHDFPFEITEDRKFIIQLNNITPKVISILHYLYPKAEGAKLNPIEIIAYCKEHPDVPNLKDMLHLAYIQQKKFEIASRLGQVILQEHPQYVLFRTRMAEFELDNGKPERVPEWLGKDLELDMLYPDRELFHVEEVLLYYAVVVKYYMTMERTDESLKYLLKMTTVGMFHQITLETQMRVAQIVKENYDRNQGNKSQ